jgi:hypothetical protein
MLRDAVLLFGPVIGLAANVVVQVAGYRFCSKLSLLKSIVLGFAAGVVMVCVIEPGSLFDHPRSRYDNLGAFLVNLLTYSALGYCYFHFVNLGETARRVRILRELYDSPNGLRVEEILARYNARSIIRYRMDRLRGNGQVIVDNGRYVIGNPSMLLFSRILMFLKLMLLGKKASSDERVPEVVP